MKNFKPMLPEIEISTANCGLKYKNRDDLLLIALPEQTAIAGMFTSSSMPAAPIVWCKEKIAAFAIRGLVVNAGNANAFTGCDGILAVKATAEAAAAALNCSSSQIMISSTGVIGEPLKFELITAALPQMVKNFRSDEERWMAAARAIMTTDTKPKLVQKFCKINDMKISLIGFAKGSGMIAPNMATMLAYIFTDANIAANLLQELLQEATESSFNSITVDSDQSTNDTILLFATKKSGGEEFKDKSALALHDFKQALNELCLELAKQIVIDGEGAKKLIEVAISSAATKQQAKEVAFAVANSPLVKTAIAGCDPNWGRIVMAVGKSCPQAKPELLQIKIGEQTLTKNGARSSQYDEKSAHEYLKNSRVKIEIDLGLGLFNAKVWTCDLNEEYIKINKDYRS